MLGCWFFSLFLTLVATSAPPRHHVLQELSSLQLKASSKRLSGEVTPSTYTLVFRLEEDFFTTHTFTGTATIMIAVDNLTTKDASFQFHAKDLTFTSKVLKTESGDVIEADFSNPDPETDFVTVTPESKKLETGNYMLVLEYNGVLSERSMVGFYQSSYIDDFKQKKYVAATQFEEIHARRAFPCFDEPEMKATFSISLTYPKGYHVWSNGISGSAKEDKDNPKLETVRFTKTPKMSTYLVAFLVAEFNCKAGDTFNEKVTIELCSEINAMDTSAKVALDAAPQLLKIMSDFTNYNYSNINKLTLAAIPDFAPGAMENWGLVTFRESALLWYENESSNYNKQSVLTVLAHELSHQWFGDYVTLSWWSDMFLNEGFATYFAYHAADQIEQDWELPKQFVIEQLQSALESDSFNTSLSLSYDTNDADFSSRTNDVSYNKGASILRMVHHFFGIDNFKNGIVDYIAKNSLSSVTPANLWESLQTYVDDIPKDQQPPEDVATIMENWITKPGYPLLTVKSSGDDVVISQQEFSLSGEAGDTKWYVPITYSSSADDAEDTSTRAWLTPKSDLTLSGVLKDDALLVLNNQQVGYYRVEYDGTLLSKIIDSLNSNIDSIDEISRAALIDDQFNLARANKTTYREFISFLTFLSSDDSYYSWYAAFNTLDYIWQRSVNPKLRHLLSNVFASLMTKLMKPISMDKVTPDDHLFTLKQVLALTWACKIQHFDCEKNAVKKFEEYKADVSIRPSPNLRYIIYCNGLRNSQNPSDDYDFLWNQFQQTRIFSEKITILQALGCTTDESKRKEYLEMALTEEVIRLQDAEYVFSSVYSSGPEGVTSVINFIVDNHEGFIKHFDNVKTLYSVISSVADYITTQDQIDSLAALGKVKDLDQSVCDAVSEAVVTGKQNLEEIKWIEESFDYVLSTTTEKPTKNPTSTTPPSTTTPKPNKSTVIYVSNLVFILTGYVLFNLY